MRYREVLTEFPFYQVTFEMRMNRLAFELVRKDTGKIRQIDDAGYSSY